MGRKGSRKSKPWQCKGCGYSPAPRRAEHDRLCDACLTKAVRLHPDGDTIVAELLGSGAWLAHGGAA